MEVHCNTLDTSQSILIEFVFLIFQIEIFKLIFSSDFLFNKRASFLVFSLH